MSVFLGTERGEGARSPNVDAETSNIKKHLGDF